MLGPFIQTDIGVLVRGERKEENGYGVRNESTLGLEQITRIRRASGGRIREKEKSNKLLES